MAPVKIDYLAKDELIYELILRGQDVSSELTVNILRKTLRAVIQQNIKSSVSNLSGKLSLENELKTIENKVMLTETQIDNLNETNNPLIIAKIETKIGHITLRTTNLLQTKLNDEQSKTLDKISNKIKTFQNKVSEFVKSINFDQLNKLERDLDVSNREEERIEEVLHQVSDSEETAKKNEPYQLSVGPQKTIFPSQPQLFSKLTNPIENFLSKFKLTNGLNSNELLHFINNFLKLRKETSLTEQDIYQLLKSYAEGPLLNKIVQSENSTFTLDQLHSELLKTFIPVPLRERLKQELIFRPQNTGEPLAVYFADIRSCAEMLRCEMGEEQIVEVIKGGINPEDRSRLIFQNNPTTFQDLDQLCIAGQAVQYNDHVRSMNYSPGTVSFPVNSNRQVSRNNSRPSCYNCGRVGHVARQCFRAKREQKN